jgi:uncharacterized Zn-finger protein
MSESKQACTRKRYEVRQNQLPLCCPLPEQRLWDAHPRVYLSIEETGFAECPYCDAEFHLIKE